MLRVSYSRFLKVSALWREETYLLFVLLRVDLKTQSNKNGRRTGREYQF